MSKSLKAQMRDRNVPYEGTRPNFVTVREQELFERQVKRSQEMARKMLRGLRARQNPSKTVETPSETGTASQKV